jgi:hypothetical protein
MLTLAIICSGRAASLDGTCAAPYDVIIASDLVYSVMGARLLAHSIIDNLKPGGMLLMVCEYSPLPYFFVYLQSPLATNLFQAHTKRLAVFFGEDGQLQRESSDSSLDEFCKTLILPFGP